MTTVNETSEDAPVGLWRDDNLLVVSRQSNTFPARCIKSDSTEDVSWHSISSEPGTALVSGFTITMGMVSGPRGLSRAVQFLDDMKERQVFLELPLSSKWYSRWKRTSRIGWSIILGALFCFFAFIVGYVAFMALGVPYSLASLLLIPAELAFPAAIAGVIYMVVNRKPIFTLKKVTSEHIWMRGASSQFLAHLPVWQEN